MLHRFTGHGSLGVQSCAADRERSFGDRRYRRVGSVGFRSLAQKQELVTQLTGDDAGDVDAIRDILRVGTSAGGARAKAIIAWNELTHEVRSGQVTAPEGFTYWLIKFDGVSGNRGQRVERSQGLWSDRVCLLSDGPSRRN